MSMKKLLIDIGTLPEEGKSYSGELDSRILGVDDAEVKSAGPLCYDLFVQRFEGDVFLQGKLSASFMFRCGRCMEEFPYTIEIKKIESVVEIGNAKVLDVTDVLREEVVIEIPQYPKCELAGQENECLEKTSQIRLDKGVGSVVKTCPADEGVSVWKALDALKSKANEH